MARVAGVPILGLVKFIKKNLKGKGIEDFLKGLDNEEDRQIFQKRILPTEWYPYRTYVNLLELVDKYFGKGDLSFAREQGRLSAEADLKGIYRAFLRVGPWKILTKRVMNMWRSYYDTGKMEVLEIGETRARFKISEFREIHKVHCKTNEGWIERFLELSGAQGVHVRETQCMTVGAPSCIFEVEYVALSSGITPWK